MRLVGLNHKNLYNLFVPFSNMPTQDTSGIKNNILLALRQRGPSLPIHIANDVKISALFASAFLSELLSEKQIILSHMKVGNSPLYLLPGQEYMLEKFAEHLKSKEKDAFMLLRDKKILKDIDQHPAIRVALRSIRDFAIPFKQNNEIYWRYLTVPEVEVPKQPEKEKPSEKGLDIFSKEERQIVKAKKKSVKRKPTKKKNDIFFNKVKEFLSRQTIVITEVESLAKNELILKIKSKGRESLLFAYNKKRISETDIIKAGKKAKEINLPYVLLSKGGPLKKVENLLEALRDLDSIETLK